MGPLFKDLFPFKTSGIALDQRLRALVRDLNNFIGQYFKPNANGKGGFALKSSDGLQVVGSIGGDEVGILQKNEGSAATVAATTAVYLRVNNVRKGTQDVFIKNGPAFQIYSTTTVGEHFGFRQNANVPVPGEPIVWGLPLPLLPNNGANTDGKWVQYADGTQICWHRLTDTVHNPTWTYPQPFIGDPFVQAHIEDTNNYGNPYVVNIVGQPTGTTVSFRKKYWTGLNWANASNEALQVMAIGRWF